MGLRNMGFLLEYVPVSFFIAFYCHYLTEWTNRLLIRLKLCILVNIFKYLKGLCIHFWALVKICVLISTNVNSIFVFLCSFLMFLSFPRQIIVGFFLWWFLLTISNVCFDDFAFFCVRKYPQQVSQIKCIRHGLFTLSPVESTTW